MTDLRTGRVWRVMLTKRCCHCKKYKDTNLFYKNSSLKDGLDNYCIECFKLHNKEKYIRHRPRRLKEADEYRKANRKKFNKRSRDCTLRKKYGIGIKEYNNLLRLQNNRCLICGMHRLRAKKKFNTRLHVDHNHNTKEIRGLLCNNCNAGLGYFNESIKLLKRAMEYLNK